jgi:hypothetical protein
MFLFYHFSDNLPITPANWQKLIEFIYHLVLQLALVLSIIVYLIQVLATYLLEGRILTML